MQKIIIFISVLLCSLSTVYAFEFHWELDETPEGSESATVIAPVQVVLLDELIEVPSHSASLTLMRKYSVHLTADFTPALAHRLLQTFESIPQLRNSMYEAEADIPASVWQLTDRHLLNDIEIEYRDDERIVTLASEAFTYANPLLAEIDGVRGRYFSKRLHRAIVRFATDNGADRRALDKILEERYAVSVNVLDYTELTKHTTGEHAGRFDEFKNEELIALIAMLEEYPTGMIKTPGLKYLVRRLDGTPHPLYPSAPAVAWTGAGYIEFMESAFKEQGLDFIHRLVLHEKAHFLWDHLFDDHLKQDWIKIGGWYENPDDADGWSTTKQTEFVSAYAHGKNPNEDMAESISFYIVNPDKLRSRSPAKYAFIQNRVMHGTRYISRIREDLTFEVYNLYPDYVYPGKIVNLDIQVSGGPEQDKQITIDVEIHETGDMDAAGFAYVRVFSDKGTFFDVRLNPIDTEGRIIDWGHTFRGHATVSRYAAHGYWHPDQITFRDATGNARHSSRTDFGWKLHIDNPLADCEPPQYVPNSLKLSLSDAETEEGRHYQIVTVMWRATDDNAITGVYAQMNDETRETYSRRESWGEYNAATQTATVGLVIPDYFQSGTYTVSTITMQDVAGNGTAIYFTNWFGEQHNSGLDEPPVSIFIETPTPDVTPPELDINNITIIAEPTNPEAPNGETNVDITFRVRDDISGYLSSVFLLRDPQGITHRSVHGVDGYKVYFRGDPTVYHTYTTRTVLPAGSTPGIWGLAEMTVMDKAQNARRFDFTEIVRFEVSEDSLYDLNADGEINILDLVIVANAIGESESEADVNKDGTVNILDLVIVANAI